MKHSKITNSKLVCLANDFIQTALGNDFTFIGVSDYALANKYRLKGVKQLRTCQEYLAFAYDSLGNKTVLTPEGQVFQL